MDLDPELADLVAELAMLYPRFKRVTIERLVQRTANDHAGAPSGLTVVRRLAIEQLTYVDTEIRRPPMQGATAPRAPHHSSDRRHRSIPSQR